MYVLQAKRDKKPQFSILIYSTAEEFTKLSQLQLQPNVFFSAEEQITLS